MAGRTGRRPGHSETRSEILDAARGLFAERGFAGASIRAIAATAGVDPALVHHYYGTKDDLFRAALAMPIDPPALIEQIVSGGPDEAPRRLAETFVRVWDSEDSGPAMVGFLRRVIAEEQTLELARDFVGASLLRDAAARLLSDVDPDEAATRVALVIGQMLGLMLLRRVLHVEPLASMPAAAVVDLTTPHLARHLYAPLPATAHAP